MWDIEGYTDAVLDELARLGIEGPATNLPDTVMTIGHCFMKGRDPVKVAHSLAQRLSDHMIATGKKG